MSALQDRVRHLIQTHHEGNVREASRALAISQATLYHLLRDRPNPRVDLLEKIARWYDVPLEWLVSGTGPAPTLNAAPQGPGWLQWRQLLGQLIEHGLSNAGLEAWRTLPAATIRRFEEQLLHHEFDDPDGSPVPIYIERRKNEDADRSYRIWVEVVERWVADFGVGLVAQRMEELTPWAEFNFDVKGVNIAHGTEQSDADSFTWPTLRGALRRKDLRASDEELGKRLVVKRPKRGRPRRNEFRGAVSASAGSSAARVVGASKAREKSRSGPRGPRTASRRN
jgi:transcriptional regulator with XRE-family HTH domain